MTSATAQELRLYDDEGDLLMQADKRSDRVIMYVNMKNSFKMTVRKLAGAN